MLLLFSIFLTLKSYICLANKHLLYEYYYHALFLSSHLCNIHIYNWHKLNSSAKLPNKTCWCI